MTTSKYFYFLSVNATSAQIAWEWLTVLPSQFFQIKPKLRQKVNAKHFSNPFWDQHLTHKDQRALHAKCKVLDYKKNKENLSQARKPWIHFLNKYAIVQHLQPAGLLHVQKVLTADDWTPTSQNHLLHLSQYFSHCHKFKTTFEKWGIMHYHCLMHQHNLIHPTFFIVSYCRLSSSNTC